MYAEKDHAHMYNKDSMKEVPTYALKQAQFFRSTTNETPYQ
jgi:hypothetical protein